MVFLAQINCVDNTIFFERVLALTIDKVTKWQNKNAFIFSKEYFQKKVLLKFSKKWEG